MNKVPRSHLSVQERTVRQNRPANRALCFGNYVKAISLRISLTKNSRVLEFGCGPGTNILKLEASDPEFVAFVDIDPAVIATAISRNANRHDTTNLRSCSFTCLDFLTTQAPRTIYRGLTRDGSVPRPFTHVLAFYSLQHIARDPDSTRQFFINCHQVTAPLALIIGIMPNAPRVFSAAHRPANDKSLFSVTGMGDRELCSWQPYGFQVTGETLYHEFTLCTDDMKTAAAGLFAVRDLCSIREYMDRKEHEYPVLCASLFSCIVERVRGPLSPQELELIDLYDIIILQKINDCV